MRNLLRFIINSQFALLFLLFEIISLSLVVRGNKYQQSRYTNFAQNVNGYFSGKINDFVQYFSLKQQNSQLLNENRELKSELEFIKQSEYQKSKHKVIFRDSLNKQQYTYFTARIINNSVDKQYNFITLDKGNLDGIVKDMAVITPHGVVGKVVSVTENFSLVMSVLNRNSKISAKFKKNNYFGSFEWPGLNYRAGTLNEIPLNVNVAIGDTIVTTGFSTTFPPGILVGFVSEVSRHGGSFYQITVRIANDFRDLYNVYIVTNRIKEEQLKLETK